MARIGMVNYINTAPIYEVWKEVVSQPDWEVVEAQPSQLNRMLAEGRIDMGFVSSFEYAARPQKYRIFDDLSISATGEVGSVFLFSSLPPEEMDGRIVLLTGQSDTSVCLVRIILEEFYKVKPKYVTGDAYGGHDKEIVGVLAIGDVALRLKIEGRYPLHLDLADKWFEVTGLPFVFAVFAVSEQFILSDETLARKIRETLLDCRKMGMERFGEICARVANRIPMDCEACSRYLQGIEYDLSPVKLQALELFFSYLVKRGEADEQSLPLKLFK